MSKGSKTYDYLISTILFSIVLVTMLVLLSNFMMRKTSYIKNADFYSYEEDYDVLFLGTSHMIMGVSPMELWNDYGITSYNLGNYGQWIPVNYWALKNALDYTNPKLVVLDVKAIEVEEKYSENHMSQMHDLFDTMPLSRNKISAVYDLLPKGKRMEFLFHFSLYHSRWNEIDSSFWKNVKPSTEKGANLDNTSTYSYASIVPVLPPQIINKDKMNHKDTVGKTYLRKIIELCQENNIEVLLTALPYAPTTEEQEWLNSVQEIADEYKIKYLDLILEDSFINYNTDFYDEGHLNSSGCRKTTQVLGNYLVDNYNLEDHRKNDISDKWNQDYIEYTNYKIEWLQKQNDLKSYLMLLADKKFNVIIKLNDKEIWDNIEEAHLLENLGVDINLITEKTDYIIISEGGKNVDVLNNFQFSNRTANTSIGGLSLCDIKNATYSLCLDNREKYTINSEKNMDIEILVIDKDTLERMDYAQFNNTIKSKEHYY